MQSSLHSWSSLGTQNPGKIQADVLNDETAATAAAADYATSVARQEEVEEEESAGAAVAEADIPAAAAGGNRRPNRRLAQIKNSPQRGCAKSRRQNQHLMAINAIMSASFLSTLQVHGVL